MRGAGRPGPGASPQGRSLRGAWSSQLARRPRRARAGLKLGGDGAASGEVGRLQVQARPRLTDHSCGRMDGRMDRHAQPAAPSHPPARRHSAAPGVGS